MKLIFGGTQQKEASPSCTVPASLASQVVLIFHSFKLFLPLSRVVLYLELIKIHNRDFIPKSFMIILH